MHDLAGKVAVVTGGASGIGLALARRFVSDGMHVVVGDVEKPALDRAVDELAAAHGSDHVLGVVTDVSDGASVDALAKETLDRFGAVHVVCNNAGVGGGGGPMWELSEHDWAWTLGVNLWGVIHGIRAFVPHLVAQGEGHVVNTASVAGLLPTPFMGPYGTSKHAVVALSEILANDLAITGNSGVGVSVLCPGWVATNIATSDRNRPTHYPSSRSLEDRAGRDRIEAVIAGGMDPAEVASHVADAIRERRFYVLTHPEMAPLTHRRSDSIRAGGLEAPLITPPSLTTE